MRPLCLVFMGTPEFAVPALQALIARGHEIAAVYTQAPAKAGRGMKQTKGAVQRLAETFGIPVYTPANFKRKEDVAHFRALDADAAVVAAYGLILPKAVLEAPRLGCVNIHASLLPRWRGAAPIQRAILAGDKTTGVSIMVLDEGLDTGALLKAEAVKITPGETASTLHDKLAQTGAKLIGPVLEQWGEGKILPVPQDDSKATYAPKVEKKETAIDWRKNADEVDRYVRAFHPRPGAWFAWQGKRYRVLEGKPVQGKGRAGEVLDGWLTVACGKGAYRIARLQREGKRELSASAFLRGTPVPPGTILA